MCGRTTWCRRFERDDGDADGVGDGGIVGVGADRGADLRRTRVRARPITPGGPRVPLRGVMKDVGDQCFKEELPCGEALDEAHGAATAGTRPRRPRRCGRRFFDLRGRCDGQGLPALGKLRRPAPRGEETEVADADKALRQYVEQEAAKKIVDVER